MGERGEEGVVACHQTAHLKMGVNETMAHDDRLAFAQAGGRIQDSTSRAQKRVLTLPKLPALQHDSVEHLARCGFYEGARKEIGPIGGILGSCELGNWEEQTSGVTSQEVIGNQR